MLKINNEAFEITKEDIFIGKSINNGEEGYNINIQLEFTNKKTNEKGYLNLAAGFEKNNNIDMFLNREYKGIPFENDNQYISFEIFDTKNFFDSEIESPIILQLKEKSDDKVEAIFDLDNQFICLEYDGYLNIKE